MNIKRKIFGATVVASMMASVVAPSAFAATNNITLHGGGAFSYTKAVVKSYKTNKVVQANSTNVYTFVGQSANTGGNSSSFNTGGTNTITTGKAKNTTAVSVTGGTNINTSDCGCADNNINNVDVSGGGAFSYTKAVVVNSSSSTLVQANQTNVGTGVLQGSSTGYNSSSFNTGGGNSTGTGNAVNEAVVVVGGNSNSN